MKKMRLAWLVTAMVSVIFVASCKHTTPDYSGAGAIDTVLQLEAPKVSAVAYPGLNYITWEPVASAKSYELYRNNTRLAAFANTVSLVYEDVAGSGSSDAIQNGISYTYKVVAISATDPSRAVYVKSSESSATVTANVPDYSKTALTLSGEYKLAENINSSLDDDGTITVTFPARAYLNYEIIAVNENKLAAYKDDFKSVPGSKVTYHGNLSKKDNKDYNATVNLPVTETGTQTILIRAISKASTLYHDDVVQAASVDISKLSVLQNTAHVGSSWIDDLSGIRVKFAPAQLSDGTYAKASQYKVFRYTNGEYKAVTAEIKDWHIDTLSSGTRPVYYFEDTDASKNITNNYIINVTDGTNYGTAISLTINYVAFTTQDTSVIEAYYSDVDAKTIHVSFKPAVIKYTDEAAPKEWYTVRRGTFDTFGNNVEWTTLDVELKEDVITHTSGFVTDPADVVYCFDDVVADTSIDYRYLIEVSDGTSYGTVAYATVSAPDLDSCTTPVVVVTQNDVDEVEVKVIGVVKGEKLTLSKFVSDDSYAGIAYLHESAWKAVEDEAVTLETIEDIDEDGVVYVTYKYTVEINPKLFTSFRAVVSKEGMHDAVSYAYDKNYVVLSPETTILSTTAYADDSSVIKVEFEPAKFAANGEYLAKDNYKIIRLNSNTGAYSTLTGITIFEYTNGHLVYWFEDTVTDKSIDYTYYIVASDGKFYWDCAYDTVYAANVYDADQAAISAVLVAEDDDSRVNDIKVTVVADKAVTPVLTYTTLDQNYAPADDAEIEATVLKNAWIALELSAAKPSAYNATDNTYTAVIKNIELDADKVYIFRVVTSEEGKNDSVAYDASVITTKEFTLSNTTVVQAKYIAEDTENRSGTIRITIKPAVLKSTNVIAKTSNYKVYRSVSPTSDKYEGDELLADIVWKSTVDDDDNTVYYFDNDVTETAEDYVYKFVLFDEQNEVDAVVSIVPATTAYPVDEEESDTFEPESVTNFYVYNLCDDTDLVRNDVYLSTDIYSRETGDIIVTTAGSPVTKLNISYADLGEVPYDILNYEVDFSTVSGLTVNNLVYTVDTIAGEEFYTTVLYEAGNALKIGELTEGHTYTLRFTLTNKAGQTYSKDIQISVPKLTSIPNNTSVAAYVKESSDSDLALYGYTDNNITLNISDEAYIGYDKLDNYTYSASYISVESYTDENNFTLSSSSEWSTPVLISLTDFNVTDGYQTGFGVLKIENLADGVYLIKVVKTYKKDTSLTETFYVTKTINAVEDDSTSSVVAKNYVDGMSSWGTAKYINSATWSLASAINNEWTLTTNDQNVTLTLYRDYDLIGDSTPVTYSVYRRTVEEDIDSDLFANVNYEKITSTVSDPKDSGSGYWTIDFTDSSVRFNKKYSYIISAVDINGNENWVYFDVVDCTKFTDGSDTSDVAYACYPYGVADVTDTTAEPPVPAKDNVSVGSWVIKTLTITE